MLRSISRTIKLLVVLKMSLQDCVLCGNLIWSVGRLLGRADVFRSIFVFFDSVRFNCIIDSMNGPFSFGLSFGYIASLSLLNSYFLMHIQFWLLGKQLLLTFVHPQHKLFGP